MSFKVYINEGEWDQICAWVLKYPDIETGGDLFGLWLDEQTAVVQFVLGPGKKCDRTTTSFFQDVDYLREAGTYLTEQHGLCNVGQWHSHHKINLFEPSMGDENTVWSNMPNLGLDRYIVFIANISNEVTINCFLFQIKKKKQLPVKQVEFKTLRGNSPMRLNEKILQNVHNGAEPFNDLTVFKKEIKYIRNKDGMENHDVSNKNKYETSRIGNRMQEVERRTKKGRYPQVYTQKENQGTTPQTIRQGSEKSNFPTSAGVQKEWAHEEETLPRQDLDNRRREPEHKRKTYKTTAQCLDIYTGFAPPPRTPIDQSSKKHNYPTTTSENKQKQQDLKKTTSKSSENSEPAIIAKRKSQEHYIDKNRSKDRYSNTSGNLKRKSGDYDNVKSDIELHQHNKNRSHSQYSRPSKGTPEEVIDERSSSPSGTLFKSSKFEIEEAKVTELKTNRSSCMTIFCCMSKVSRTDEPKVDEIRPDKVEPIKISYV